jgi:hypothetical protein
MKRFALLSLLIAILLGAKSAAATENRFLVRTTLGLDGLKSVCAEKGCEVRHSFNGRMQGLFLVTGPTSVSPQVFMTVLHLVPGVLEIKLLPQNLFGTAKVIVRTTLGFDGLRLLCSFNNCNVIRGLDGSLNQLFLVRLFDVLDPIVSLNHFQLLPGIVDAELDQVFNIVTGGQLASDPPSALFENNPVSYYGSTVWMGYATQPATNIIRLAQAQTSFQALGQGVIADIDTGVDPTHPALQGVLLPGYDFTRNQSGASELSDLPGPAPSPDPENYAPARVNQYSVAMVDQYSVAMVDGPQYAAFGHGTEVVGILHLVAPHAMLLPLKAFHSDGTGALSDILRAIYYAAQNNVRVVNMSFDLTSPSAELAKAISSSEKQGIIFVASSGNDGTQETVYPAGLTNVMGVASTDYFDQRSFFSNYGNNIVWVAAPGEGIVTTYPFGTYAAVWGTSFSAPFVSGGASLLLTLQSGANQNSASRAISHGQPLSQSGMGNGRLDLYQALSSVQSGTNP